MPAQSRSVSIPITTWAICSCKLSARLDTIHPALLAKHFHRRPGTKNLAVPAGCRRHTDGPISVALIGMGALASEIGFVIYKHRHRRVPDWQFLGLIRHAA